MNAEIAVRKILETPFWVQTLEPNVSYVRQHDDTDGKSNGRIFVTFDIMGDAYVGVDTSQWLRFRTFGGGGLSPRTRNALMILAEAIRLDNQEKL